jgi:hypothetical protein
VRDLHEGIAAQRFEVGQTSIVVAIDTSGPLPSIAYAVAVTVTVAITIAIAIAVAVAVAVAVAITVTVTLSRLSCVGCCCRRFSNAAACALAAKEQHQAKPWHSRPARGSVVYGKLHLMPPKQWRSRLS